jgi:glycosyltransferase involved in cell wall biosynthesis
MTPDVVHGLVSTIIPVHNRPTLLVEAVLSVLAQSYRPIEVIIVDDGSTDTTREVAEGLAEQYPADVLALHQENAGPGVAREVGRLRARGQFIQYLDSDDVLFPEKFERQVRGLRDRSDCGVSYGKTRHALSGDGPWKRTGEPICTMFPAFLQSRWWGTSTPLYRREVVDNAGPWAALWQEEDWEYDCRIAALGVRLHYCDEFVSEQRAPAVRLSAAGVPWRRKMRDRAAAHRLIYEHAIRAGIAADSPEMCHFARELFLLVRQCGAARLPAEARMLFDLAREASGPTRGRGWDFRLYRAGARVLGWSAAGRVACLLDGLR